MRTGNTVSDYARQLYEQMSRQAKEQRKFEIDPSKVTNRHGLTGLYNINPADINENFELPDSLKEKIIKFTQESFLSTNGAFSDSFHDELDEVIRPKYLWSVAEKDRASATNAFSKVFMNESKRLQAIVKEANPNWKPGDPFDVNLIKDYINSGGFDQKV